MLAALATVGMQPPVRAHGRGPLHINVPSNVFQDALAVYNYQNQRRARVTSVGDFSNSQGKTTAEAFGDGAVVGNTSCLAIGNAASASGSECTAIGKGSIATGAAGGGTRALAVGASSVSTGNRATAVGYSANCNSPEGVVIGNAGAAGDATGNIAIGGSSGLSTNSVGPWIAIGYAAVPSASNQCVIGGTSLATLFDMYFGKGVTHATPIPTAINAGGGSGTNIAGGALRLAGGKGTGNAAGGNVLIQTSTAGGSGTTLQTLATVAEFGPATVGFYGVTPAARPAAYTPTNVTTDRAYDANATTLDEVADVLGTLIADLQSLGLVA